MTSHAPADPGPQPVGTASPVFLAGPTACGKSGVALFLAEHLGGEIVSVDSMQVYRGLDVGTAKPSAAERARVPHHLLDLVELGETFDTARWLALARVATAGTLGRGRVPIFCGGTGLYFQAWFQGLNVAAGPDPRMRAELETSPLPVLLAELSVRDPIAYATIDRRNPRRVIRAVEILRQTGRTLAENRRGRAPAPHARVLVLRRDPADLRRRIDERVDAMFASGLVEETRAQLGCGLASNRTAMQAIGYRQVAEHICGERDLPATMALIKTKTWQFARRQMTWFRHQLPVEWIDVPADAAPESIAARVLEVRAREA